MWDLRSWKRSLGETFVTQPSKILPTCYPLINLTNSSKNAPYHYIMIYSYHKANTPMITIQPIYPTILNSNSCFYWAFLWLWVNAWHCNCFWMHTAYNIALKYQLFKAAFSFYMTWHVPLHTHFYIIFSLGIWFFDRSCGIFNIKCCSLRHRPSKTHVTMREQIYPILQ